MPSIGRHTTRWPTAYSIDVRAYKSCPLRRQGIYCEHPMAVHRPGVCLLEIGKTCYLEEHPVLLHRTPDWLYEAQQEAELKHAEEEDR